MFFNTRRRLRLAVKRKNLCPGAYDPTHILFTGAYAEAVAREERADGKMLSDAALEPAHITKGRTMDDAPKGTRLIHVGLTTFIDSKQEQTGEQTAEQTGRANRQSKQGQA